MDVKFPDVTAKLVGGDGNAFAIIGEVSRALRKAGHKDAAAEFQTQAFACESYDALLVMAMKTVNVE